MWKKYICFCCVRIVMIKIVSYWITFGIHLESQCKQISCPRSLCDRSATEIVAIHSNKVSFIWNRKSRKYIGCVFSSCERTHYTHALLFCCLFSVRHLHAGDDCRQKNEIKNVIRVYIEMWIQYLCIRIELIQTYKNCVRSRTFDFHTTAVASHLW